MKQYRIEVETNGYGENFYIPQVGEVYLKGSFFLRLYSSWENIVYNGSSFPITSKSEAELYNTKDKALDIIEKYKIYIESEDLKKTVTTKYINL